MESNIAKIDIALTMLKVILELANKPELAEEVGKLRTPDAQSGTDIYAEAAGALIVKMDGDTARQFQNGTAIIKKIGGSAEIVKKLEDIQSQLN